MLVWLVRVWLSLLNWVSTWWFPLCRLSKASWRIYRVIGKFLVLFLYHISYRVIFWFTGSNRALKEVKKRVVFEYLRLRSVQFLMMKCYRFTCSTYCLSRQYGCLKVNIPVCVKSADFPFKMIVEQHIEKASCFQKSLAVLTHLDTLTYDARVSSNYLIFKWIWHIQVPFL